MLSWISWIVALYLLSVLAFFVRSVFITNRYIRLWKKNVLPISKAKLYRQSVKDCFLWPVYLVWYGLSSLIDDFR